MKLSRNARKLVALTLSAALVLGGTAVNSSSASAAKKATLKLNKKSAKLAVGKKVTLKVTKKNVKSAKVTWKSSKKAVASVSKKGVVTAKKAGKAKISATIKYKAKGSKKTKKKTLKCTVTVVKNTVVATKAPAPSNAPAGTGKPAPGGNATPTPAPGGDATPTPAPGGDATPTPAPGGDATPTPAPGGDATPTPAPGGDATPTPAPGGDATPTPAPGGDATPTPAPGGDATPAPGGDATPAPGGDATEPPSATVAPPTLTVTAYDSENDKPGAVTLTVGGEETEITSFTVTFKTKQLSQAADVTVTNSDKFYWNDTEQADIKVLDTDAEDFNTITLDSKSKLGEWDANLGFGRINNVDKEWSISDIVLTANGKYTFNYDEASITSYLGKATDKDAEDNCQKIDLHSHWSGAVTLTGQEIETSGN